MTEQTALQGFDDFVHQTMQNWKVPGISLAVVRNGEVILNKGYGYRSVEQNLPATPDTLFAIGSTTKAFTTMGLALLVDEGRIEWDKPVRNYLPAFKMHDPYVTENLTIRDLVCHRSGLPRHDAVWYNSSATREELVSRLQYLEPTAGFRALWQYQNLMFMTAGYLAGQVAGQSWENFTAERIFKALGMKNSNFSVLDSQKSPDHARPYQEKEDKVVEVPFRDITTVGPAGSINSSVNDMLRWLMVHLSGGKNGDRQFVSEGNLKEMHTGHMLLPIGPLNFPETLQSSYGLGWAITPYRGRNNIWHTGGIDGFSALVTFLPAENIGVIALTNLGGSNMHQIIAYNIFDRLMGLEQIDWNARFRKITDDMKTQSEKVKAQSASDRKPGTQPSHPLDDYTGDYEHPGYGQLSITKEADRLKGVFNALELPLEHYHYDVFEAVMEFAEMRVKVAFSGDLKGGIESVSIPFEPTGKPIIFKRMPDKRMMNKDFLDQFTGKYEVMNMILSVTLREDNTLMASIPGQPDVELVPYQGTMFSVKGREGFSIEFKKDEANAVTEAVITQPGGSMVAKKQ